MTFEPIAIIGRACLLPGAASPEELWQTVLLQKNCLNTFPDFEQIFDPQHFYSSPEDILQQDILCQWLLHTGREALKNAGYSLDKIKRQSAGVVMGNLSYPTLAFSRYAQSVWTKKTSPDIFPQHRFMSAYPVQYMAKSLGLNQKAYAIDAACASSLYAIKLACDELQTKRANIMLAGGVNAADTLFLHKGFFALNALSPTGQSRPLHPEADGLMPSQGAALLVLQRLEEALQNKNKILGVIRGIGLSNDGAQKGFLAPSALGQITAIKKSYQQANIHPSQISRIECHATGTKIGDMTEIDTLKNIFSDAHPSLSLGILKANIGHTITASGAAAIINILSAFEHHLQPPALYARDAAASEYFKLSDSPEDWFCEKNHPYRYAGINSFGFGGNNAHIIIQDWNNNIINNKKNIPQKSSTSGNIAITAVNMRIGEANINNFKLFKKLLKNKNNSNFNDNIKSIKLPVENIHFPPADLKNTLGQQLIILDLIYHLINTHPDINFNPEKTSVLIGMQTDAQIARYSLKWRLADIFPAANKRWLEKTAAEIMPPLTAAHVIGCMPNILTNRINHQFNFQGPSFSVSAEEHSGLQAVQIGIDSLMRGESDVVIAGAVDLCCEAVQTAAMKSCLPDHPEKHRPCDAAVILVLQRAEDAQRAGTNIELILDTKKMQQPYSAHTPSHIETLAGYSHAASGLLNFLAELILQEETLEENRPIGVT